MRKCILFFFILLINSVVIAQSNDPQLKKRLDKYLELNKELKFTELMTYIHPSLFKLVPKEQLIEVFEKAYDNEAMHISIDSAAILLISPAFKYAGASYKKIDYSMKMGIYFKDTAQLNDPSFRNLMITSLGSGFNDGAARYDSTTKTILINGKNVMMAIKDNDSAEWMFLGIEKKQPDFMKMLFKPQVITHFKLL